MTGISKAELLGLENQYWQAMKEKDAEAMARLTDFPCTIVGPQGIVSVDQEQLRALMEAPGWSLEQVGLDDDAEVRRLSGDVAMIACKVHEELIVEDSPVTIDAADASVWVRRDGRWLCALHTESIAGDPYGRDRRPGR